MCVCAECIMRGPDLFGNRGVDLNKGEDLSAGCDTGTNSADR